MRVKTLLRVLLLIAHIGQDKDYLNLNLNYAVNVFKFALIIKMFPELLKPYVAISCHLYVSSPSLRGLFHARYPTFHRKSGRKWNSSDLWWRSVFQKWRCLGMIGMTSPFAHPFR